MKKVNKTAKNEPSQGNQSQAPEQSLGFGGSTLHFLTHKEPDGTVIVEASDKLLFSIRSSDLIEACSAHNQRGAATKMQQEAFTYMLGRIADWANAKKDKIKKVCMASNEGELRLIAVLANAKIDYELEDSLSDLVFDLAQTPETSQFRLTWTALPPISDTAIHQFGGGANSISYVPS